MGTQARNTTLYYTFLPSVSRRWPYRLIRNLELRSYVAGCMAVLALVPCEATHQPISQGLRLEISIRMHNPFNISHQLDFD